MLMLLPSALIFYSKEMAAAHFRWPPHSQSNNLQSQRDHICKLQSQRDHPSPSISASSLKQILNVYKYPFKFQTISQSTSHQSFPSSKMADHHQERRVLDTTARPESKHLIIWPKRASFVHLMRFLIGADMGPNGPMFLECSGIRDGVLGGGRGDHRFVIVVSVILRRMVSLFAVLMKWTGYALDFVLNLLYLNGNLTGLVSNFIQGKVMVPKRGTETFISSIGHLDGRIDLLKIEGLVEEDGVHAPLVDHEHGSKALMDLCILASKLAYENARLVKEVVIDHWKMHFVDFYNCWNDFQKRSSTQVFILCDKPNDANLILVSFRGTEPFDADDWSTDFDYSWYKVSNVGKLHMGFVEAMGLGNRTDISSFDQHLLRKDTNLFTSNGLGDLSRGSENSAMSSGTQRYTDKLGAYYMVRDKLNELLAEHRNAKVVVTGHSLGGALAILFPTVLLIQDEDEMIRRILGVYTFGQPRIGDTELGNFMEAYLNKPNYPKYVRVVYCNDIVPRIPCDDTTFLFRHFGKCLYCNSLYKDQEVDEEPNRNYFEFKYMIPAHLNAVWELIRAFLISYSNGSDYKEGWLSIWLRVIGLAFPGLSAHSPREYINSIRLGSVHSF